MAGTVGVLMAGFMSVSVYALEEKDVIGTWYVMSFPWVETFCFIQE